MPTAPHSETVSLEGDLVIDSVRRASALLLEGTTAQTVVVDLSGVRFMDSTGLRMLLDAKAALATQGRSLVVRNPTGPVMLVLTTTGTAEHLGVEFD